MAAALDTLPMCCTTFLAEGGPNRQLAAASQLAPTTCPHNSKPQSLSAPTTAEDLCYKELIRSAYAAAAGS